MLSTRLVECSGYLRFQFVFRHRRPTGSGYHSLANGGAKSRRTTPAWKDYGLSSDSFYPLAHYLSGSSLPGNAAQRFFGASEIRLRAAAPTVLQK